MNGAGKTLKAQGKAKTITEAYKDFNYNYKNLFLGFESCGKSLVWTDVIKISSDNV